LQRQVDTVLQAYAQADPDLRLSTFGEQEGWGAIVGERGDR
jgi:hypothetical protein